MTEATEAEARQKVLDEVKMDFTTLVLSLRHSTLLMLGMAEDSDADLPVDCDGAKTQISILEVLQDKTKGNLSEEEDKLLRAVLYECRVAFVDGTRPS